MCNKVAEDIIVYIYLLQKETNLDIALILSKTRPYVRQSYSYVKIGTDENPGFSKPIFRHQNVIVSTQYSVSLEIPRYSPTVNLLSSHLQ